MNDIVVETHSSGVEMQIDKANAFATFAAASQAQKDCNFYCKQDTENLIKSSLIHSDLDKGVLRWVMPYAEMQYELVATRLDKNPNATYHWCDTAYANHGDEWQRIFAAALRRGGG